MDALMTVLVALIGGGMVGFIQFLITRHDSKKDKNNEILIAIRDLDTKIIILEKKVDMVDAKSDERNAVTARIRILRFRDEMLEGKGHTHDSFQQILEDIDAYEEYCSEHPEFRNNQTIATVDHIKRNYAERLEKHDFL